MTFMVRTIFRYAVFAKLTEITICLQPIEIVSGQSVQFTIHNRAVDGLIDEHKKLYGLFPIQWFISREKRKRDKIYGSGISLFFALSFTSILLWLLL